MANIVVTSDTNFLYITYNDVETYSAARKIRKSLWVDTDCLSNDDGVELDMSGSDSVLLNSGSVDSVNAITDLDTDAKLFNALKDLM
jgi:hypothetical protein